MVDPAYSGSARIITLLLIDALRTFPIGRLVFLRLVVDLHRMTVGVDKLIGRTVPDVTLDPSLPVPVHLQRAGAALQCRWTDRPPADVAKPRLGRLGELQRTAVVIPPGAQVGRLALSSDLGHPEH